MFNNQLRIASELQGARRQIDFSPERITTPLTFRTNDHGPEKSAFQESMNRQLTLAILGTGIAFPAHEVSFQNLCKTVLSSEYEVRDSLAKELAELPLELEPSFISLLTNHPMVCAILSRLDHHQYTGFQMTPGVALGFYGDSPRAGWALASELDEIYATLNKEPPQALRNAYLLWGTAQSDARQLILHQSWLTTTHSPNWPRPTMFDRSVSMLLEGMPVVRDNSPDTETRTLAWLDGLEMLRSGSSSNCFQAALLLKNPQISANDAAKAFKMLRKDGLLAWAEYVTGGSPHLEESIIKILWPHNEVRPSIVRFDHTGPSGIVISSAQALDYWSQYIAKIPLEEVVINISASRLKHSTEREFDPVAIASTPLAQHIKTIAIDLSNTNSWQLHEAMRRSLHFLEALVKESAWHNNTTPNIVELQFNPCNPRQRATLQRVVSNMPSHFQWSLSSVIPSSPQPALDEVSFLFTSPKK